MSPSRPLVSVVIPCYNQGRYLSEAVAGVAARDALVEVVIVDDGSGDDTAAIASGLERITYVRQDHAGLAAARNRGLEASAGTFVIFVDADDHLLPGAIDTGVRALAANPDCAMAYGRCVMMGPGGELWPAPEMPTIRCGHFAALLRTNLIWLPAMAIFRRGPLVGAGGFDEEFDAAADYDVYLRIAKDHPIHDHGQLVAAYRRHEPTTAGDAAQMLRETLAVMLRNCPDGDPALLTAWREGYANWQDFYGMQLAEEIRRDVYSTAPWRAIVKAITLARLAPAVFRQRMLYRMASPEPS